MAWCGVLVVVGVWMQLGLSVEFGFGSCWMRVSFSVFYILEPKVCGFGEDFRVGWRF